MIIEAEKKHGSYNIIQVIDVIQNLSHSQGFYTRLYNEITEMARTDKEAFERFKTVMEAQEFKDDLDVIMYFET